MRHGLTGDRLLNMKIDEDPARTEIFIFSLNADLGNINVSGASAFMPKLASIELIKTPLEILAARIR